MERDAALHRFAELVAADSALLLPDWQHLDLVSVIEAGTPDLSGFCYLGDGRAVPVSPSDVTVFDALEALREAMATADGRPDHDADGGVGWVAALFRIDRTGELRAEYEYHDAARWAVTPATVRTRAEQFRPA